MGPGRYGDGNGLYLLVRPNSTRFWLFRYTVNGRMREMGLGPLEPSRVGRAGEPIALAPSGPNPARTLAEARILASDLFRRVRMGGDPLADRAADKAKAASAMTFAQVGDACIAAHEAGWRNAKHRQQWRNTLATYAAPILVPLPIADADVSAV